MKQCIWKIVYKYHSKTSPNPSKGGESLIVDGGERKERPPPTPPKEGRDKWGNDLKTKSANIQSVYSANLYLFGTPSFGGAGGGFGGVGGGLSFVSLNFC